MMKAGQLVQEIKKSNMHTESLKNELKEVQKKCTHDYINKTMYKVCRECNYIESLYY